MTTKQCKSAATAVGDSTHADDIRGAFGTIVHHDVHPRRTFGQQLKTLLAILGPGLIVMVGDNDAGAFGTYSQAGQNYGTTLLWTLFLLSIHPPLGQVAHDFLVPKMSSHAKHGTCHQFINCPPQRSVFSIGHGSLCCVFILFWQAGCCSTRSFNWPYQVELLSGDNSL